MIALRKWFREKKEINIIRKSGWFDKDYYRVQYKNIRKIQNPIRDYIRHGAKEGINPNSWFDGNYYLSTNTDVKEVGMNPFLHYVISGQKEGRFPNADKEKERGGNSGYKRWAELSRKKRIGDIFNIVKNFRIIMKSGEFDGGWYLSKYCDVYDLLTLKRTWKYRNSKNPFLRFLARISTNACLHFVTKGVYLGYSPNPFFDLVFYMDHNADLCQNLQLNPFVHYLCYGKNEGREPGRGGNSLTNIYLHQFGNADVMIEVSVVAGSKSFLPVKESEYKKYDIEVVDSSGDYVSDMEKCHGRVVWFLEESCDFQQFMNILDCRIYFADPSIFAVCCQGTTEMRVASYLDPINNISPLCTRFESKSILLRRIEILAENMRGIDFNSLAHRVICGAKIVYTNLVQTPLERMSFEELCPVYESVGSRFCTNTSNVMGLYHEIRRCALVADAWETDWKIGKMLETMSGYVCMPRILISIYAFSYGGGEIMPIRLANALWEKGYQVGVHVFNTNEYSEDVRGHLCPSIPVIFADNISTMMIQMKTLGYNIINTHHQACQSFVNDVLAKDEELSRRICHVATSHGMYENFDQDTLEMIFRRNDMVNRISSWTYVADKNIEPFKKLNVYDKERFVKIPNGMKAPDIRPFDLSVYGITKDDFVVTIVSRALVEKGWLHAIHAVERLHDSHPEIHLLLVGAGEVYDKYAGKLGNEYIHFLGFQENPCDIFAVSNLCLLPSYYPSESAPLCLIEAMMCKIPSVATEIGDIREMLTNGGEIAGKIISLDHHVNEDELVDAIRELIEDQELYKLAVNVAERKRTTYLIDMIAEQYVKVYCQVIERDIRDGVPDTVIERERETEDMLWNAKKRKNTPKVSVIVPNYNHERFLKKRLDSIYGQSYQNLEVLLMDDCSTDNSRKILQDYATKYPEKTKLLLNDKNSGGVFYQWAKGIRNASGELCWIAESDDYCEVNFLETLVPQFKDSKTGLAYAKYVFVDEEGKPNESGFWDYMGKVDDKKWRRSYRNTAIREIGEGLGIINTIPNASGAIFRNPGEIDLFSDSQWYQMKICGDWIFYMNLLKDKNIAYRVEATSYFRFHSNNSSAKTYTKPVYYREHGMVASYLWDLYHPDDEVMMRQKEIVWKFYQQNVGNNKVQFEEWYGFSLDQKKKASLGYGEKEVQKMQQKLQLYNDGNKKHVLLLNPIAGLKNRKPESTLEENMDMVGKNTGNQVFVEAVRQQINGNAETWVHPVKVKEFDSGDFIAVMPCSNYIIEGPMPLVRSLVELYKNTNLPIIPIGLGAQSSKAGNTPRKLVQRLQQHVITWLKLVSERTVSIGVRGEFTAECLDLLGIHNYRVIGCPTLYKYLDGNYPVLKEASANQTLFTTTAKNKKEAAMLEMAVKNDSKWIMQMMTEYPEVLYNNDMPHKEILDTCFPGLQIGVSEFQDFVKRNAKIFFDFQEWDSYLQKEEFTFAYGSRFHGNMMALRNGIPALWITHDSRTSELVNTLHLPHISIEKALKFKSPQELIPFCDYSDFYEIWPGMVREYVSFLEENGIDHKFVLK